MRRYYGIVRHGRTGSYIMDTAVYDYSSRAAAAAEARNLNNMKLAQQFRWRHTVVELDKFGRELCKR